MGPDTSIEILSSQGRILYALSTGPKNLGELIALTKLSTGTIYYNIKDLILRGLVIKVEKGRYAITEKGLRVLRRIINELQLSISPR